MTENESIIRAFCKQFSPELVYVKTAKINNMPYPDAWQTSWWDDSRSIGITTVAYGGGIHAFIEAAGKGQIAGDAGRVFARALGLLWKPETKGWDQLPDAFANMKFDGFDVLPVGVGMSERDCLIWLYRAACMRVNWNGEPYKGDDNGAA